MERGPERDGAGREIAASAITDVPLLAPEVPVSTVRASLIGHRYRTLRDLPVCVDGRLVGLVRVEDLLAAEPAAHIRRIMDPSPPTVLHEADREAAVWHAVAHEESSLVLVDAEGRFQGIVPPSRLLDLLMREHEQDLARLGGYLARTEPARLTAVEPVWRRLGHRMPWLLLGLAGALAGAGLVGWFEDQLRERLLLALFIPGIVYLADAVGTQTETLVIRALSIGVPVRDIVRREVETGLIAGLLLGAVLLPTAVLLWGDVAVALTVALAVFAAATIAGAIAIGLPVFLRRLGADPAFGSGPLATVIQDLLSIVIYFALATAIIQ